MMKTSKKTEEKKSEVVKEQQEQQIIPLMVVFRRVPSFSFEGFCEEHNINILFKYDEIQNIFIISYPDMNELLAIIENQLVNKGLSDSFYILLAPQVPYIAHYYENQDGEKLVTFDPNYVKANKSEETKSVE